MSIDERRKIESSHLQRQALLYVRQSTLRQVHEHRESTQRQYAFRQKAIQLGWSEEQVVVIDEDLARSGASIAAREGFKRLVAEVSMGKAGIVMGLEVSRLARSCSDWHRLLELCSITETLIMDEDGLYDLGSFNDRLLLGLKGTMSEAELHMLQSRMRGGALNKAKRGELAMLLPTGYVRTPNGEMVLDPDEQVQAIVRLFFDTFKKRGSISQTVQFFHEENILFPTRMSHGTQKGQVVWRSLSVGRARAILHNPRYAGAYVYGKGKIVHRGDGTVYLRTLPEEQWHTLLHDAHEGYITWQTYQDNQKQIEANKSLPSQSPPREGCALLQGLAICGLCGSRMTVQYRKKAPELYPIYQCKGMGQSQSHLRCQYVPGKGIDQSVGDLLLEIISPAALEVALAVQEQLETQMEEVDRILRQDVERAEYEAALAQRRYMQVDPENRLVAQSLETQWNEALRAVTRAQGEYEKRRQETAHLLDKKKKKEILALATDFPRLWKHPDTPQRERKRLLRLIIEDVTLVRGENTQVHIRFKGGATRSLVLPRKQRKTISPESTQAVDELLDHHTYSEVARILNDRGLVDHNDKPFTSIMVGRIRKSKNLASRRERLRKKGLISQEEIASRLGLTEQAVRTMRNRGTLPAKSYKLNDIGECMYEPI